MSDDEPTAKVAKLRRDGTPRRKPGPAKRKLRGKQRLELAERRAKALTLHVSGATYADIAHELGYGDPASCWQDVRRALREIVQPAAEEAKASIVSRLERHYRQVALPIGAVADTKTKFDQHRQALAVLDRLADIHGVKAPVRVQHSGVIASLERKAVEALTDEELEAAISTGELPDRLNGTNGTNGAAHYKPTNGDG